MGEDLQQQLQLSKARVERLKKARAEAEKLLEQKSRELFDANMKLENAQKQLKDDVKQATYELSVTNERLQKSLNERSAFIGKMSHEVRTPLNAIIGLSEVLFGTRLDDLQSDYIETINSGAKSLVVLLNDMLDITKIEAGRVEINPEPTNTQRLHKNIVAMFELTANKAGLDLRLDIDASVPSTIRIDKGRYKQIVDNLISNALKNTERGGVLLSVSFTPDVVSAGTGMLSVKVTDTGVGIAESQLKRIFNAYEQIGRPSQGHGLGLAICQQLSELMMGKISCESKVGRGSIFTLSLPAEQLPDEGHNAAGQATPVLTALPQLKILIAEDNPTNQKVITAQLAQLGQLAEITNNGAEALARLKQESYDVVILDIIMPVMDGEETIKTIRASERDISQHYCVALTASNFQDQRERLLKLGFDDFLSKPLGLAELSAALSDVPRNLWVTPAMNLSFDESRVSDNSAVAQTHKDEFDFSYLKTQFGDAYKTIFVQIAPTFLDHAYQELAQLKKVAQRGDIDRIKKTSHSMKGAVSSIGLASIAHQLLQIETTPDAPDLISRVDQVNQMMQAVKPLIQRELEAGG